MRTPLHSAHQERGATFREYHGWEIPDRFNSFEREYAALRQAAGVVDLAYRGKLAAMGPDRVDYLHRMLSNEVQKLAPGQGNYCFLLNAQGHILADMNLLVQPDRILLDCEPLVTDRLRQTLDRFIIMDQVELEDLSAALGTIGVEGPLSREVASGVLGMEPRAMKPLDHVSPEGSPDVLLVRALLTAEGFWVIAPSDRLPDLWERLVDAAARLGGGPAGFAALEAARIEAGIPRYGADIVEKNLPQETGQFRAISFTKGCYPGQEIVERIRSRGHIPRKLVGLISAAQLTPGATLEADGRQAGEVTSTAYSPGLGKHIALGYVRREHADPGSRLRAGSADVEVTPLPFPQVTS